MGVDDLKTRKLRQILVDFHTITGQHIAIFDNEFRLVAEYPDRQCEFCLLIRSTEEGAKRCHRCDAYGMKTAQEKNAMVMYTCHAGLTEVCAPISEDNEILGYIMLGQLLTDEDRKILWATIREKCEDLDCSAKDLHQAFTKMRQVSPDTLSATSRIMMACVGFIRLEQLMKRQSSEGWKKIQEYIASHLITSFTLQEMADELCISVATICKTVKHNTGKTVGQLVVEDRVRRAGQYLVSTDRPISEIAEIVGIEDYNYFTRVFRKQTGMTPTQYRRCSGKKS